LDSDIDSRRRLAGIAHVPSTIVPAKRGKSVCAENTALRIQGQRQDRPVADVEEEGLVTEEGVVRLSSYPYDDVLLVPHS
jgi:hypothetical protein